MLPTKLRDMCCAPKGNGKEGEIRVKASPEDYFSSDLDTLLMMAKDNSAVDEVRHAVDEVCHASIVQNMSYVRHEVNPQHFPTDVNPHLGGPPKKSSNSRKLLVPPTNPYGHSRTGSRSSSKSGSRNGSKSPRDHFMEEMSFPRREGEHRKEHLDWHRKPILDASSGNLESSSGSSSSNDGQASIIRKAGSSSGRARGFFSSLFNTFSKDSKEVSLLRQRDNDRIRSERFANQDVDTLQKVGITTRRFDSDGTFSSDTYQTADGCRNRTASKEALHNLHNGDKYGGIVPSHLDAHTAPIFAEMFTGAWLNVSQEGYEGVLIAIGTDYHQRKKERYTEFGVGKSKHYFKFKEAKDTNVMEVTVIQKGLEKHLESTFRLDGEPRRIRGPDGNSSKTTAYWDRDGVLVLEFMSEGRLDICARKLISPTQMVMSWEVRKGTQQPAVCKRLWKKVDH